MMLNKAIEIATKAHDGQVDKAEQPYIGHPLRVMAMGTTEEEKIVGVLHDVVEDSDWTFERLTAEGFSSEVVDALQCVTKLSESEPYDKFIQRVKANPLAVKVKINDLTDNMDICRLAYISEKDVKRLRKYRKPISNSWANLPTPSRRAGWIIQTLICRGRRKMMIS